MAESGAQPAAVGADAISPARLREVEAALLELSKALRAVSFYPSGHPSLQTAMDRADQALRTAIGADKELMLGVGREGLAFGKSIIGATNPAIAGVARDLYLRQIKRLFFLPDVSAQDIEQFLGVV